MGRVVVLDLDRTLVHTTPERHFVHRSFHVKEVGWCHVRPYVSTLLRALRREATLVIWTAGTALYALDVVAGLLKHARMSACDFAHILSRDDLVYREREGWVKDLAVVRELTGSSDVTLLDDDPLHARANPGCVVMVPMFDAASPDDDSALCDLSMRLTSAGARTLAPAALRPPPVVSSVRQFFSRVR